MVLPDYRNRVIQGGDSIAVKAAGLPNITGDIRDILGNPQNGGITLTNAFQGMNAGVAWEIKSWDYVADYTSTGVYDMAHLDASVCNSIYGGSNTVQPPAIVLIPQIKY